jgi:Zn finger protein HypA/HybF involved in hydrogenase expression
MSEFGKNFDKAQRRYDDMMPEPESQPIENECQNCHELFEADEPRKYCDNCTHTMNTM